MRDTTALAVGSAVSGVLAYVVFALTTRELGPEAAAPVSVLWSYWSFAGAAFAFPLQHWIAKSVTTHGENVVRSALPRLSLALVATSLLLGLLAWLGRDQLFQRDDLWFPGLVVLVTLGSAVIGVARGGLSARRRFVSVGWSLAAENGVRCVAVGALILADVSSPVGYGLCLVLGHLVAFVWPSSLRFGRQRSVGETSAPFGFLTGAALAQLLGQVVLTGGPVVLALAGGSPTEVTALFAALALFRAPYILALGLVSQLTGIVARLIIEGKDRALRRIRNMIVGTAAVGVVLAGAVGALLGPALLKLIFGDEVSVESGQAAVVAVACTIAVANLVLTVTVLAQDRPSAVVRSWLIAVVAAGLGFVALTALPPSEQTVWSFLIAETVGFAALLFAQQRGARSTG